MLKRLLNMVLVMTLVFCVYSTFAVKNNVYEMQKYERQLQAKINAERDAISVYRTEWSMVSSAMNVANLQRILFPDYKTVTYDQMQLADLLQNQDVYVAAANIGNKELAN